MNTPSPGNSEDERLATINRLLAQDEDRVATINRLLAQDQERVETINRLLSEDQASASTANSSIALDEDRVATINRLLAQDRERVETIDRLLANEEKNVAAIGRLLAQDQDRVATVNHLLEQEKNRVKTIYELLDEQAVRKAKTSDGMFIEGRNLAFLQEPNFAQAWEESRIGNIEGWPNGVPDARWRARITLWAAQNGLRLKGDFVECGVHTGLFSLTICHALNFASLDRKFYLFDTYDGIPLKGLKGDELTRAKNSNAEYYKDVYAIAQRNFAPFANACLIKGILPSSLEDANIQSIAYLSIDLNNALAEKQVIEKLWDKVVSGAAIIVDDYLWNTHETQYKMWNEFAHNKGTYIAPLPTGQGLIIKP